jgi:transcriptional regulator with XRE-family HTH domain
MNVGENIRKIREDKGFTQQQIADLVGMHRSNYSKVETAQRELSINALAKVAKFFDLSLDELVNFEGNVPKEVTIEDKTTLEQVKLIGQLEPEDKNMVFRLIDTIVTKQKFKTFFAQNLAVTQ